METPLLNSGSDTWAPSGIAFAGRELLVAALGSVGLRFEEARALKLVFTSGDRLRDVLPVGRDSRREPKALRKAIDC